MSRLQVKLKLNSRRFRCQNEACSQKIFCERWDEWLAASARRTKRLAEKLYEAGIRAGGQAGSHLVQGWGVTGSRDTVLRTLRRKPIAEIETPKVVGVDDWAKRKGINYGTILVDLEQGRVLDLLPDRQSETLAKWLKAHPGVETVTRDRSTVYAAGISEGAPQAQQVADRFHLLLNLTDVLAQVIKQYSVVIKKGLQEQTSSEDEATAEDQPCPTEITEADKRRIERLKEIHRLDKLGHYRTEIAQQLHLSRQTVGRYLQLSPETVVVQRKPRRSLITAFVPYLQKRWQEGCHNRMQLYREIKDQGYRGTASNVRKYIQTWQHDQGQKQQPPIPAPRSLAWLITQPYKEQAKRIRGLIKQLQAADEKLALCIRLARQFAAMVRQRSSRKLETWLQAALASEVTAFVNFAKSLRSDKAAVLNALTLEWSNGPTEGFINKLKLIKRQMYGRAKLDLLKLRLLALNSVHQKCV